MAELITRKNIGKEMVKKLNSIGITSSEELAALGAKKAFQRLRERHSQVCLVHLYTLEGAIQNIEFHSLPEETKRELRAFKDSLKA